MSSTLAQQIPQQALRDRLLNDRPDLIPPQATEFLTILGFENGQDGSPWPVLLGGREPHQRRYTIRPCSFRSPKQYDWIAGGRGWIWVETCSFGIRAEDAQPCVFHVSDAIYPTAMDAARAADRHYRDHVHTAVIPASADDLTYFALCRASWADEWGAKHNRQ
jgi:hypothetical protein